MLPVIVLVGQPNVGKSTLFNRMTGTRTALVADFPGLTRDRQYGRATWRGTEIMLVDTGGIGVEDHNVDTLMGAQSTLALQEADLILFVVDARMGKTAQEEHIAERLRKLNKPVLLVVNKVDGVKDVVVSTEFQSFGFAEYAAVSAVHGRGIDSLWSLILGKLPRDRLAEAWPEDTPPPEGIRVAFVGRPNVGKSTLMNRILGYERVVVYDLPGTTRDSIFVPFERDEQSYVLIDTAGVRRRGRVEKGVEKFSVIKTLQAIDSAHVCLLMLDAQEGLVDQDLHVLSAVLESGKAAMIVVNKWDGLSEDEKKHVQSILERRLTFVPFVPVRMISAKKGTGVNALFQEIQKVYTSASQPLSTPQLTRILQRLVEEHAPPLVNGRRVKLRYAHPGGNNPPVVVIHGNQLQSLPDNYKRYLSNGFIKYLALEGTPVSVVFKAGRNPYEGKRNTLTPRQLHKRKRLIRHIKK